MHGVSIQLTKDTLAVLGLPPTATADQATQAITALLDKAKQIATIEARVTTLQNDLTNKEQELKDYKAAETAKEVSAILDKGIEAKQLTAQTRAQLEKDYAANPEGLKAVLATMPSYNGIVSRLNAPGSGTLPKEYEGKDYIAMYKADLLAECKEKYPDHFAALKEQHEAAKR